MMSAASPRARNPTTGSVLDPRDWDAYRELLHQAVEALVSHARARAAAPVWQPVPAELLDSLAGPIPQSPREAAEVFDEFRRLILPYSVGNTHPRFFGWVHGTGLASGLTALLAEATMNANCGGREHAAIHVERAVLRWFRDLFRMPDTTSGILLSGTSMANLVSLAVARERALRQDSHVNRGELLARLRVYASAEVHGSIQKSASLLGFSPEALRLVAVDAACHLRVEELESAIAADQDAGLVPAVIIGTAGTVRTGAIDPLADLAGVAAKAGAWFHVDGAFGALGVLAPSLAPKLTGLSQADSIAFDFHKWMFVQYAVGCALIRDGALHRATFASPADYLRREQRGTGAGADWPCDFGPELSRPFLALRIWFALEEHGIQRFSEAIERNVALAAHLARRIEEHPAELELGNAPETCVVCFRYANRRAGGADWDAVNTAIAVGMQEDGVAVLSMVRLNEAMMLRAAITNHRTSFDDIDLLVAETVRRGRRLAG